MGREEKRQSLNETCTKLLNTFLCAYEALQAWQYLAPLDSQVAYLSTHGTVYATLRKRCIQLGDMWWGHTCIPHHVMWSARGLGTQYSKKRSIQWDFQCRSPLESTRPLAAVQCTVTMWPHKPGTPGCLIRLITCVWNLGFQPEKGAMLLHSKHKRQTHDGMGCETRPM